MSFEFMGQQFTSAKAWSATFPAYGKHFWKYVKAGAKTPTEVEKMAYDANQAGYRKRDAQPNRLREGIIGLASRRKA